MCSSDLWALFDQRIFDIASQEEEFIELFNHGGLHNGETVADAVASHGLDGAEAEDTIATYNKAAIGAVTDPFGRLDFGGAPLIGPYYACKVLPALFHTQGGLRVDANGRALRADLADRHAARGHAAEELRRDRQLVHEEVRAPPRPLRRQKRSGGAGQVLEASRHLLRHPAGVADDERRPLQRERGRVDAEGEQVAVGDGRRRAQGRRVPPPRGPAGEGVDFSRRRRHRRRG